MGTKCLCVQVKEDSPIPWVLRKDGKKNSLGRLIVIGGEVENDGTSSIKESNNKDLVLLGVMSSKSYSWRTTIHFAA